MSYPVMEGNNPTAGKRSALGHAAWLRALERTTPLSKQPGRTFPVLIEELARRFGPMPALVSDREIFRFQDLAARANKYARWALERELQPGTVVGLMMANRPEYLAIWLGLTRVGCVTALLNTNLAGPSLSHCIDAAGATHVIASAELASTLAPCLSHTRVQSKMWVHGSSEGYDFEDFASEVEALSGGELERHEQRAVTLNDRALCIYTSGTTGFPKAANISHRRIMAWTHWFAGMMDTRPEDRLYNCLPFYHSVGGVAATGALLVSGGSVFVREKFSARNFWKDVREQDCTVFQYIGELCRYLVSAPASHREQDHRLRLCCGNGLSGDIWRTFKERFGIPHILEFYAATEANFSLYNTDEEPGAIGRVPAFLSHRFPIKLIKLDSETLEPLRNEEGLCVPCLAGEAGEAVFRISAEERTGAASFEGYTGAKDSAKKLVRNVMVEGDSWYRTGDLMRKNEKGFFFFADRLGDTFRWKGENVSTSEVMHAIADCPGVKEAAVYGIALPGVEGKAGMAAIAAGPELDLGALKVHLNKRLPRYAQPLFLRLIDVLDITPTFRPKKAQLAAEGCNPKEIAEPLYFNDQESGSFVRLTAELFEQIAGGRIRL